MNARTDYSYGSGKYFIDQRDDEFCLVECNYAAHQELSPPYEELEVFGTEEEAIAECDKLQSKYDEFLKTQESVSYPSREYMENKLYD